MIMLISFFVVIVILAIVFNSLKAIRTYRKSYTYDQNNPTNPSVNKVLPILSTEDIIDFDDWYNLDKGERWLMVLSSSCDFCRGIFETFWNEVHLQDIPIDVSILVDKKDIEIQKYLNLYDGDLNIKLFKEPFVKKNNFTFMPVFLKVDKSKTILKATPNVFELISANDA